MATDFTSSILKMREKCTLPIILTTILATIGGFWFWWLWIISCILITIAVFINGLYVIMPGHAGYKITLGKMAKRSFPAGFGWMIPFISSMSEVDITKQTHQDSNTMKNINRRDVTLTYVLTWFVREDAVHILHSTIGETDYIKKSLCPQLDACMTNIIASKTYDEINAGLSALSLEIMNAFSYDTALFRNIELNIIDVKFDKDYEEAIAEAAKTEMQRKIVEEKAEQLRITANAKAEALKIQAAAEAEALKIKGASENEVKERLGEILNAHPEILKETLAKNFPKVFGGGNTMINLNDLLNV